MPRILERDPERPVEKIKPRTNLLREGLNQEVNQSYYIDEEEVMRAGINVSRRLQRMRWYGGEAFTWLGVRKRTGRGNRPAACGSTISNPSERPTPNEARGGSPPPSGPCDAALRHAELSR